MPGDLCTAPRIISLSSLSLATDVTDATLEASGLWLETRTGAGGTVTLAAAHGCMDSRIILYYMTDVTLGARDYWLGTRIRAGGTATLA